MVHLPIGQSSCGSQAFFAKKHPQSIQRFSLRYEQGSHWPTRRRCDCSPTRLKPEAANLAMEPAKEAAMPRTVGGETPAADGVAWFVAALRSLSWPVTSRAFFNLTGPRSIPRFRNKYRVPRIFSSSRVTATLVGEYRQLAFSSFPRFILPEISLGGALHDLI